MSIIRFVLGDDVVDVRHEADGQTLLSVALDNGVPILFNCERGSCCACLVTVSPLTETPGPPPAPRTEREALVLEAMGRIPMRTEADADNGSGAVTRLACQYVVGDEDIAVVFDNALGSF